MRFGSPVVSRRRGGTCSGHWIVEAIWHELPIKLSKHFGTPNYGIATDGTQTTTRIQGDTVTRVFRFSNNNNGINAVSAQFLVSFRYRGTGEAISSIAARTGATAPVIYLPAPAGAFQKACANITSGTFATAILDLTVFANSDSGVWQIQVEQGVRLPSGVRWAHALRMCCRSLRGVPAATSATICRRRPSKPEIVIAAADYTATLPVGRSYPEPGHLNC